METEKTMKGPFTLYKRPLKGKNKHVYYVQFRDEEGNRLTGQSTSQTSKGAAVSWAIEQLNKGVVPSRVNMTFGKYSEPWFVWGKCRYIQRKLDRGKSFSHQTADTRRIYLEKQILPFFRSKQLRAIKPYMVDDWIKSLQNKYLSGGTINLCLRILKIMVREALRRGFLSANPAASVEGVKEDRKSRVVIGSHEVKELFDKSRLEDIWGGNHKHYTLNMLAASTGMRLGECQGLQIKHVHQDHVEVRNVWERKYGLKDGPKCGSVRVIPIPSLTSSNIQELIEHSPFTEPDSFVFYSTMHDKPVGASEVRKYLYRAFEAVGIMEAKRRNLNLTFHSWRHFFNSFCRTKIPDAKLRRITGHRTEQMTEYYTHFNLEDFRDVQLIQEKIFA